MFLNALNMSQVSVRTTGSSATSITQYSIECPFCHSGIIPNYIFLSHQTLFARCPNETCNKYFILSQDGNGRFTKVEPNSNPNSKVFSEIINSISPQFVLIYNQAYYAEQTNLDQICGVGYRKALEFLIKDYLISKETD